MPARGAGAAGYAGSPDADQDTAMTTRCRWWATVLATTATLAMSAGAATLPAGAARPLPAGQSVMSVASADLTGDGRQDYVVALRASAEQTLRGLAMQHRRVPCWCWLQTPAVGLWKPRATRG